MADENENEDATDDAESLSETIEAILEQGMGIEWHEDDREEPNLSNRDVIHYLAHLDPETGASRPRSGAVRNILPGREDVNRMAELYTQKVDKQLSKIGGTTKKGQKQDPEKLARAAAASGLKAAAQHQAFTMATHISAKTVNTGAPAERVTEKYAAARARKWGVNEAAVYVASGQLAQSILQGNVRLIVTEDAIGSLLGSYSEAKK